MGNPAPCATHSGMQRGGSAVPGRKGPCSVPLINRGISRLRSGLLFTWWLFIILLGLFFGPSAAT